MLDPLSVHIPLTLTTDTRPALPRVPLLRRSPDHADDYILEFDYSSLSDLLKCPRKYENAYVLGRVPIGDDSATSFGDLFHRCESLRMEHGLTAAVVQRQQELVSQHFADRVVAPNDHRTAARMLDVLMKYNSLYHGDGWPDKVLLAQGEKMIERPFKLAFATVHLEKVIPYSHQTLLNEDSNEFLFIRNLHLVFVGKIDLVLSDSADFVWCVDHKTTKMGGSNFENAFLLSLQTRGYGAATRKLLNVRVFGCIVNALIIRPITRTGTPTEFFRRSFPYSDDLLDEWQDDVRAHVLTLSSYLTNGFFPQSSLSFMSPCAMCDYAENCGLPRDQRHADLYSDLYTDNTWSPLH